MKVVAVVVLIVVLVLGSAMLWQHMRYLGVRRNIVQDHQPILHSSGDFHVLVFVTTAPGADVVEEVRALNRSTEGSVARWIYAGKAVLAGRQSAQIGEKNWSAIVLLQYPSRAAYDRHAQSQEMRTAFGRFDEVYAQGFQRWPVVSAMIPQALLAIRVGQIVRGRSSHFPFERAKGLDAHPEAAENVRRLREETELGAHAVVVVNLMKDGTPDQQAANRRYGASMFGAMAEGGFGPLHIGEAVRIERDYHFDTVALVYYPGVEFFADMMTSDFFQGIYGDKRLEDTQAVITVPILDRL